MAFQFQPCAASAVLFISLISVAFSTNGDTVRIDAKAVLRPLPAADAPSSQGVRRFVCDVPALSRELGTRNDIRIAAFPIGETQRVDLIIRRRMEAARPDTRFLVNGGTPEHETPFTLLAFSGEIEGNSGSKVYLVLADTLLFCVIRSGSGESKILTPHVSGGGAYLLADERFLTNSLPAGIRCGVSDTDDAFAATHRPDPAFRPSDQLLETKLALETDSEFFLNAGGTVEKARSYALAVVSLVSMLYEEYMNVRIRVTWLNTWTDSPRDPYGVKGNAYALPDTVRQYWKNNYQNVPRHLFHVMTSISYGGGGFGYYDALCGKNGDYGFAVSSLQCSHALPTFAFTYDAYIVAHEIGHNFNSPHTHSCFWGAPLDTCMTDEGVAGKCLDSAVAPRPNPGSIMSYCGGINNSAGFGWQVRLLFLPQCISIMRRSAEEALCLTPPAEATISLLHPHGQELLKPGDRFAVQWTSSRVGSVSIEYRDGAGAWTPVATGLPAGAKSFEWVIPDLCSNKIRLRIFDTDRPATADTTLLPLTIEKEDPTGLVAWYPFDGGANDEQQCHFWNALPQGNPIPVPDRFGGKDEAYGFDGASYLTVPGFKAAFDRLTVSAWFNASELNGKKTVIGTNWQEGWVFEIAYWGQIGASIWIDGKGAPDQIWGGWPPAGKWHHVALVFDGANGILYVDGARAGSTNFTGSHALNAFVTPLYIGGRGAQEFFSGQLDDIRIYKRALDSLEIRRLFLEPSLGVEPVETPSAVTLYPNPARTQAIVRLPRDVRGSIILLDLLGREIKRMDFFGQSVTIPIGEVHPGLYFCRIIGSGSFETKKFLLVK